MSDAGDGVIILEPNEFDVVRLRDGREAVILDIMNDGEAYCVECAHPEKSDRDWFIVGRDQIEKVVWRANTIC